MSLAQGAMRPTPAGTGAAQRLSSLSRLGADEAAGVIEGWLQQAGDAGEEVEKSPEGTESAVTAEAGARPD